MILPFTLRKFFNKTPNKATRLETRQYSRRAVRHSAEVINKTKSIWVEVVRRHTAPLEQDGLYGAKQLTTVCSMEVKVKGQNARCLKIPRPREQSLKCLFCTFFVCVGTLDHILGLCRKFGDEFIQFGNYYRACHLCKESKNGIVEF